MRLLRRTSWPPEAHCPAKAARSSYAGIQGLASLYGQAYQTALAGGLVRLNSNGARRLQAQPPARAPAVRVSALVQREDDFIRVAGRQVHTGALVEIVEVEG